MRSWLALLLLLAIACAAAFGWQFLAADPGYVQVRYGDVRLETTLIFSVVAIVFVWGVLHVLWRALRAPLAAWSRRRRRRGRERIARGIVALVEGRYALALRELERASHHGGLHAPALLGAACAAQARGDRDRALAFLARAPGPAARVLRARFELAGDDPGAALALLQREVDKSTLPPGAWPLLVESALRCAEPQTALTALPALARSQTLAPPALARTQARVIAAALADAADREGLDRLWSGLSRAQRRDENAVAAYARRAAALGQVLAAMSEIEAALGRAWSEALIVLYGELGPAEAEARLHRAEGWIGAQAESPGLALTLGRLCIQCKLWGKARGYLERGLQVEAVAPLWEALGDCCAGGDDHLEAERCYRNALLSARGAPTLALPTAASALSTRALIAEERSEHGVPRLPGVAR